MGKRRKKVKPRAQATANEETNNLPKTFVMHRGEVGKSIMQLEMDIRHVMEPNTAIHLKVRKNNVMKDFVHVAGPLGVTHFIIFSQTKIGSYMRIARLPHGPTLHFKIHEFSLARDVIAMLKRPKTYGTQYKQSPLMVLNGFNQDTLPMKLMISMFQNVFPAINIQKTKLGDIRRCVLVNHNKDSNMINFRHYQIDAVPVGMSRGVKKLLQAKVPNMAKFKDVSEYIERAACGYGSESEAEDPTDSHVTLPQEIPGRGNIKAEKSAVRLTELGPRMSLQLIKIEEEFCSGEVLFHEFVQKSKKEIKKLKREREAKRKLKEERKRQQEENVQKKEKEKELHKARSIAGQLKKQGKENSLAGEDEENSEVDNSDKDTNAEQEDSDNDAKWYKEEVGEEPDPDLFTTWRRKPPSTHTNGKRKKNIPTGFIKKRQKVNISSNPLRKTHRTSVDRKQRRKH